MRVHPHVPRLAVAVDLYVAAAAEVDRLRVLDALDLPRETLAQPRVGFFDLVAVLDPLVEHPVLVADAVARDGQAERRAAVEEARGEPAKAAVAEPGVALAFADVLEVQPDAVQCGRRLFLDAEIQQGIAQQAPHEKFERQVRDAPAVIGGRGVARLVPALHEPVAGRINHRLVEKRRIDLDGLPAEQATEVVGEVAEDRVRRHRQRGGLQQLAVAGRCIGLGRHQVFSKIRVARGGKLISIEHGRP